MDKDMPSRSQGGIEVAPKVDGRGLASWWWVPVLVIAVTFEVFGADVPTSTSEQVTPAAATIMESIPAGESQTEAEITAADVVEAETATESIQSTESVLVGDTVFAAETVQWDPDQASDEMSMFPLIAKVCIGLGLVVGLAWGSVWLLRRTALGQGAIGAGSLVKVVERTWLGPKKAIFLVDVAGRTLALGVTDEQISVLSAWEEGQIDVSQPAMAGPGNFAIQLKSLLKRGDAVEVGA
jgi:flagellar biogenesis protein FliO